MLQWKQKEAADPRALLRKRLNELIGLLDARRDEDAAPSLLTARWLDGVNTETFDESVIEKARAHSAAAHRFITAWPPDFELAKVQLRGAKSLFENPRGGTHG